MQPTAKLIADCNPLANKLTLPEHLSVIDGTTLSRALFWVIEQTHYDFIEEKKRYIPTHVFSGNSEHTLKYNVFLSIYDTLNSSLSKIDLSEVMKIFKGATSQLRDARLSSLWNARGLHHAFLIVDGVCKLRCLFSNRTTEFVAEPCDYDRAQALLLAIIKNMQSPVGQGGFHGI